jgi:molybdopterin-guanine dinucleotide biosynthesis protein A
MFDRVGVRSVFVGNHAAYRDRGALLLSDVPEPFAPGPLGGLLALLEHALVGGALDRTAYALAVACDMPHVPERLVRILLDHPHAAAVAVRMQSRWQPFFARYDARDVLPVARAHARRSLLSLHDLLDALPTRALRLPLADENLLRDWDRKEDIDAS